MFTPDNYYAKIKDIDFSSLPEVLRKGHEFADKVSNNGSDWANYHASSTVRDYEDERKSLQRIVIFFHSYFFSSLKGGSLVTGDLDNLYTLNYY